METCRQNISVNTIQYGNMPTKYLCKYNPIWKYTEKYLCKYNPIWKYTEKYLCKYNPIWKYTDKISL